MVNDKASDDAGVSKHTGLAHEVEGVASGIVVGALLGVAGGPPGVIAGIVIGGVAGAITAAGLELAGEQTAARARELDVELGIDGGDVGAPNLQHAPATRAAYSIASAGSVGSGDEWPAEGPMQCPDGD